MPTASKIPLNIWIPPSGLILASNQTLSSPCFRMTGHGSTGRGSGTRLGQSLDISKGFCKEPES